MVFLVNLTGLKKIYWIPSYKRQSDVEMGIWFVDVKFLCVQVTLFNPKMGKRLISGMNDRNTWM